MSAPVIVINQNSEREQGKKAQLGNIQAAKAVSDIIQTCLGPRAMLKMLLTSFGIVMTNDGNAIMREIEVTHPAAKSMIELSRAQDEEVGDGTTSVIILAGEMLSVAEPWLERDMHPIIINKAYMHALDDALAFMSKSAKVVDTSRTEMLRIIETSIGTKYIAKWSGLMCNLALDAVSLVVGPNREGLTPRDIDIKRYLKTEKIPGGEVGDSEVIAGVMVNKDVTHAGMRRRIEKPRIVLLDCPLEYKKGESQTDVELEKAGDFEAMLKLEEESIKEMCDAILKWKPDMVITEKGLCDLAQHYFLKAGVTALRRFRKSVNNRIARATGATIVSRPEEIRESDIGTQCGLFEVRKIGDDYYCFFEECEDPGTATVLLRGPGKDLLNEVERNLVDAFHVTRNILLEPRLVPGGGAIEMAVSQHLRDKATSISGVEQWPYRAVSVALEVIPRTLAQNCGAKVVRLITELRAKHASDPTANLSWGIDGERGVLADMNNLGIWEPLAVKVQTVKTAIEAACLLLRVDDIVSGTKNKDGESPSGPPPGAGGMPGMGGGMPGMGGGMPMM